MSIEKKDIQQLNGKLDDIKKLLQKTIALQLYKSGATQDAICENLGIGKGTVNKMVHGMKKKG